MSSITGAKAINKARIMTDLAPRHDFQYHFGNNRRRAYLNIFALICYTLPAFTRDMLAFEYRRLFKCRCSDKP